ncbi:MAG: FG-GAP-like repeat-containing protein, partial [Verrucomicrobia bacterium]|nr:FG-GAP-like repeat-containing protein [Verrucomicrobiota bacterium]
MPSGGSPDGTVFIIWDENFPPGPWPENHRFSATAPPLGDYSRIDGDTAAQSFGEELIGGLDFSGDAFPDLMIGDLVADSNSRNNSGRGYVFYNAGNLRGLDFKLNLASLPPGIRLTTIDGPVTNAISADTVLQGDFDGDGIDDLAIGNPHDNPGSRANAGSVHVFYGQAGGWPASIDLLPANLPGPGTMRIAFIQGALGSSGSSDGDTLCYSAAAGDINNDGRPDLLVNEMAGNGFGGTPLNVGNLLVIDAAA